MNDLPQASSVHWHGLRIDNAMDGVAGLTQDAVPPGGTFDYDLPRTMPVHIGITLTIAPWNRSRVGLWGSDC